MKLLINIMSKKVKVEKPIEIKTVDNPGHPPKPTTK